MVSYDRPHSFNGGPMYSSTVGAVKRGGKRGGTQTKRVVIKTKRGKYTMPITSKLHKECAEAEDQEKCVENYRKNRNTRKQIKSKLFKSTKPPAFSLLGYTDYNTAKPVTIDAILKTEIPDPTIIDIYKIKSPK